MANIQNPLDARLRPPNGTRQRGDHQCKDDGDNDKGLGDFAEGGAPATTTRDDAGKGNVEVASAARATWRTRPASDESRTGTSPPAAIGHDKDDLQNISNQQTTEVGGGEGRAMTTKTTTTTTTTI